MKISLPRCFEKFSCLQIFVFFNLSIIRGDDFRRDYSRLSMLCATFPSTPVLALTATASKKDISAIKESLNLKSPLQMQLIQTQKIFFMKRCLEKERMLIFSKRL